MVLFRLLNCVALHIVYLLILPLLLPLYFSLSLIQPCSRHRSPSSLFSGRLLFVCFFLSLFSLSFELKTRCDAACPTDIVYLCQRLAHTFSSVLRIPALYFVVVVVCMCAIRYLTVERDKKKPTNKQPLADMVCNIC